MRRSHAAAAIVGGMMLLSGCAGPYRPVMYRQSEGVPFDFGVPATEGPILDSPGMVPSFPGAMPAPGPVVTPGTPPINGAPAPVMPPASGTRAPPLNTPPVGPMPRLAPTPGSTSRPTKN